MTNPGAELAAFAAGLRFEDIPESVRRKTEDLLVDWFASAIAGGGGRPVESIVRFAQAMGPTEGPSEVIVTRRRSSPYLAAMANAAASHFAEQDDVHNGSVFHPATVVFPAAVAAAQALGASGRQLLAASSWRPLAPSACAAAMAAGNTTVAGWKTEPLCTSSCSATCEAAALTSAAK